MTRRLLIIVILGLILRIYSSLFATVYAVGPFTLPTITLRTVLPELPTFSYATMESTSYFTDAVLKQKANIKENTPAVRATQTPAPSSTPETTPTNTPTPTVTPILLDDKKVLVGEYFDNASVSGTPVTIRADESIDFNWTYQPPIPEINATNYSVRWHKTDSFTKGIYRFDIEATGSVRIFIDTVNIFDKTLLGDTPSDIDTPITDGNHTVVVEYVPHSAEPNIRVHWENIPHADPPQGYTGEYYDNQSLSGLPSHIQNDAAIDFDWGRSSPNPVIPTDHFSVRWTRDIQFSGGTYRFTVNADDGIRLKIDGILYIDQWKNTTGAAYSTDVVLQGGNHTVILEYYDNTGNAFANLSWNVVATLPTAAVYAEYFSNPSLSGSVIYKANYPTLDFDWKEGSPNPGVPSDKFSARFTKTETFVGGSYRFLVTADDGVRIFLDGSKILDAWKDQPSSTYTVFQQISAGTHTIIVEYYEAKGDALVKAQWTKVDGASQEMFDAEYFDNISLKGTPMLLRKDDLINFDWGNSSPDDSIPNDNFSARWTKTASFEGGKYQFAATTDDGIRVFLDNIPLIDQWTDQHETTYSIETQVASGNHTIKVEYYEHSGTAVAKVNWIKL